MLSDIDIKNSIKNNEIEISPLIEDYIQPSSVDLRVGADFRVFENHKYSHIDPKPPFDEISRSTDVLNLLACRTKPTTSGR